MHDSTNTSTDTLTTHEDVTTRTIPLDGGTAIVEHLDERVEVTIRLGSRIVAALALSTSEADALGMAVARPEGLTLTDYWAMTDTLGVDPAHVLCGGTCTPL